jgi:hypothetical protein
VSGVASGSLGTGANLEDTQVMSTAELQAAAVERAEAEAEAVAPADAADDQAVPARGEPGAPDPHQDSSPVRAPAPAVATAPVRTARAPRRRPSRSDAGRGLAGVLALALVVLLGMAALVSWGDGVVGGTEPDPSLAAPASETPVTSQRADDGKGKNCRGQGRGKGNCDNPDEGGDD